MVLINNRTVILAIAVGIVLSLMIGGCTTIVTSTRTVSTLTPNITDTSVIAPNTQNNTPIKVTPTYLTPTPQNTAIIPSSTVLATSKPNLLDDRKDCLTIHPTLPSGEIVEGTLIVFKKGRVGSYSLYNLKTKEEKEIPGKNFSFAVSPDGKFYAYKSLDTNKLMVFSSAGGLQQSIGWEKNWIFFSGWIDNQHLLLQIIPDPGTFSASNNGYPQTFMVLNPFTNQRKKLLPNYPDIDRTSSLSWENVGITAYDPTLTRVIYPKLTGVTQELILWNIPEKKQIARLPYIIPNIPKWSKDGSNFFLVGDKGFQWVSRDGSITSISDYVSGIHFYSLSPNSKYLAIWMRSFPPDRDSIDILDIKTHKITDFCIMNGYQPGENYPLPLPVWSPDGRFVTIQANYQEVGRTSDLVLIDVEKRSAVKIGSNLAPIGWLTLP